jgi:hypothetical protein
MMPPGSRASLADGFVSPATVSGQAFLDCFPRVRRIQFEHIPHETEHRPIRDFALVGQSLR